MKPNIKHKRKLPLSPNKKTYSVCALIALGLTLLTAFNAASTVRSIAETLLRSATEEELINLLTPLQYIRFRVSPIPTALGALILSFPVYRTAKATQTASRIGWIILILALLGIIWLVSLFTLNIGLASSVKIIFTLLGTLFRLI